MYLTHGTLHSLQTMNSSVITATLLAILVIGSTMAGRDIAIIILQGYYLSTSAKLSYINHFMIVVVALT